MHGAPTPRLDYEVPRIGDSMEQRRQRDRNWARRVSREWGLVEWIAHTYGRFKAHKVLIEAKASGITAAQEIQRLHGREIVVQTVTPRGDNVARAPHE
jgi:phage terminase large subunit-like protein